MEVMSEERQPGLLSVGFEDIVHRSQEMVDLTDFDLFGDDISNNNPSGGGGGCFISMAAGK